VENVTNNLTITNNLVDNVPAIAFKGIPLTKEQVLFNSTIISGISVFDPENPVIVVYIFRNDNLPINSTELFKGNSRG